MADHKMNYQAMLADMEAKRAILDNLIASFRAALAAGALGTPGEMPANMLPPGMAMGGGGDIPKGAFLGKSVPEAVNLYLATVRKKCTTAEIAEGLKKGGIESRAKKFEISLNNTLYRMKEQGKLHRFDDGWGLPDWYAKAFRSHGEKNHKKTAKKKAKKGKLQRGIKAKTAAEPAKETKTSGPQKVQPITKTG